MTADEKAEYDAFQTMNDMFWKEFKEKTRLEWRLSFGIWSSLVTAIASIFAGKAAELDIGRLLTPTVVLCIALLVLHFVFLRWIQDRLQNYRMNLVTVRDKMWTLLKLNAAIQRSGKTNWSPSLLVQLGISGVLCAVLLSSVLLNRY